MRPSPNATRGRLRNAMNNIDKAFRWVTELPRFESGPGAGNRLRAVNRSGAPKKDGEKYSGGGALMFEFVLVTMVVASVWACRFA
jgi:hypothetical protein